MASRLRASPLAFVLVCASACAGGSRPPSAASARPATIHVATSGVFHPFSEWKSDHDRPTGFAPALVESFAKASHVEVEWTKFKWFELGKDLRSGRFEIVGDGITVRPDRSILGRFTVPIARGSAVLLLKRPSWAPSRADEPASPRDLVRAIDKPELRVIVNRGGHLERITRGLFRSAKIRAMPDDDGLRQALTHGEADALMSDTFKVLDWAKGIEGLERIGPIGSQTMAFWVRPGEARLAEQLDAWLIDEEQSGRLGSMRASLLGPGGGGDSARPEEAILAATIEYLSLMPYVGAAKKREGRPASDAAEDARDLAADADAVAKAAARFGAAPPARPLVDAFFQAEHDAAKTIETTMPPPASDAPTYAYERELRPALARITEKMALLVVKIPSTVSRRDVEAQAREDLGETGLDDAAIGRIASAVVAFARP